MSGARVSPSRQLPVPSVTPRPSDPRPFSDPPFSSPSAGVPAALAEGSSVCPTEEHPPLHSGTCFEEGCGVFALNFTFLMPSPPFARAFSRVLQAHFGTRGLEQHLVQPSASSGNPPASSHTHEFKAFHDHLVSSVSGCHCLATA